MTTTNYGHSLQKADTYKATTVKTLRRRAQLVCDSPDSLSDGTRHLEHVFQKNNYNSDFIRLNTVSQNTEPSETTNNPTPVTTMIIPYIKGTYGTIARILQPHDIRLAYKPITSLRHILSNVKDKDQPHDRQGAVYRIKCTDCQVSYIGETGGNL